MRRLPEARTDPQEAGPKARRSDAGPRFMRLESRTAFTGRMGIRRSLPHKARRCEAAGGQPLRR
jgi:hypothetical protein